MSFRMNQAHTIVISGATGLIGSKLKTHFSAKKWNVEEIGRADFSANADVLAKKINGVDAIVHLAGSPIIRRWSKRVRDDIYNSRIATTRKLVEALHLTEEKPGVLISASAVGIYSQDCVQDELSNQFAGDFLGKICLDWESEAETAATLTRLCIVRLGVVMAREGGALQTMLPAFRMGIGGRIASGRQPFAWIHIDDVIAAIDFLIQNKEKAGVYNLVAPGLVNNRQFTIALGKAMKKPTVFPIPGFLLGLVFGEAAVTLTGGQKVIPMRLQKAGFEFQFPDIDPALANLLKK